MAAIFIVFLFLLNGVFMKKTYIIFTLFCVTTIHCSEQKDCATTKPDFQYTLANAIDEGSKKLKGYFSNRNNNLLWYHTGNTSYSQKNPTTNAILDPIEHTIKNKIGNELIICTDILIRNGAYLTPQNISELKSKLDKNSLSLLIYLNDQSTPNKGNVNGKKYRWRREIQ